MGQYIRFSKHYTLHADSVEIRSKNQTIGVPVSFVGENKFRFCIYLPLNNIKLKKYKNIVTFTIPDWLLHKKGLDTKYRIMDQ